MNIFSKVAKGASDFIAVVRASSAAPTEINRAEDTQPRPDSKGVMRGGLPEGFFVTLFPDGKRGLGYNFGAASNFGFSWSVSEEFRHPGTGEIIRLTVPRAALKVFKLNLRHTQMDGVAKVGDFFVFDSEAKRGLWDGDTAYYTSDPAGGEDREYKPLDDQLRGGLWN